MSEEAEYKILQGNAPDIQKVLNQWRHDYELDIGMMTTDQQNSFQPVVTLILTRTKKGPSIH